VCAACTKAWIGGFNPAGGGFPKPFREEWRKAFQNHGTMNNAKNTVAVRTLLMAAVLFVGLIAAMMAKGLISTAALAS
jgi:hypothetical protein